MTGNTCLAHTIIKFKPYPAINIPSGLSGIGAHLFKVTPAPDAVVP
jgi:hypothetical protein